jgi:predicted nucleic acid-binding protein
VPAFPPLPSGAAGSGPLFFVVLDASTALAAIFSDEPLQLKALGLLDELEKAGAVLLAPPLWESETSSNVRLRVQSRKTLPPEDERTSYALLDALPVQIVGDDTRQSARDLAMRFSMVRCYDATYLALAQARGVDVWTADEKLFNTVSGALPWVKFVGHWTAGAAVPTAPTSAP